MTSPPIPDQTTTAWLDRIDAYGRWNAASRTGKRLLAAGSEFTALRAEAERRGYAVIGGLPEKPTPGTGVDVCVLGGGLADAANLMEALGIAWTQLAPGGVIFVFAPPSNRPARGQRSRFDRATLESALVRAGFEHIRIASGRDRVTDGGGDPRRDTADRHAARTAVDRDARLQREADIQ